VYELVKEPSGIKAATLAMNVAILVYLVGRRTTEHHTPRRRSWQLRLAPD
jgi:uncharacterized membrane protein (DUF2068 family)